MSGVFMDRILVIDSVTQESSSFSHSLEGYGFDVVSVRSLQQATTQVTPSLILLMLDASQSGGVSTLKALKADRFAENTPVIVISDESCEENIVKIIDSGAHDFISKPVMYPVLAARIRSAIRLSKERLKLERTNMVLNELATRDSLTNFYNRRQFLGLATREVAKTARSKRPLAFMMIDIDHFKCINDRYGHAMGDCAIKQFASCCAEVTRSSDIIGRLGGEEFALCCPETDQEGANALAERLRVACEKMVIQGDGKSFSITVSVGVVTLSQGEHVDDVLKRADVLLYKAKTHGRNCVICGADQPLFHRESVEDKMVTAR